MSAASGINSNKVHILKSSANNPTNSVDSNGRVVAPISKTKKAFVVAAKVLTVLTITAALVTASVFSFGAAFAITGPVLTYTGLHLKGALIGLGVGAGLCALSSLGSPNMYRFTGQNMKDTLAHFKSSAKDVAFCGVGFPVLLSNSFILLAGAMAGSLCLGFGSGYTAGYSSAKK
jgi:hypothetical protein